MKMLVMKANRIAFDGDEGAEGSEGEGDEGAEGAAAAAAAQTPSNKPKVFTQDDVDRVVKQRLAKEGKKYEALEKSYKDALQNQNLTENQRVQLQESLETIQREFQTKEERLAAELDKTKKSVQKNVESLTGERDSWKNRFETTEIRRAISDAASQSGAFSADHILAILQPRTKMIALVNEAGQPTGEFAPRITLSEVDAKTSEVKERSFTALDAVEYLRAKPENAYLFRSDAKGGVGGHSGTGTNQAGKKVAVDKLSAADYRRMRKENPNALYGD